MEEQTPKRTDKLLPISIVFAALLIGGAVLYSGDKSGLPRETASIADSKTDSSGNVIPEIGDDVILGDPNAPVTFIEFGDYQCPFCKRMFDETEKQLREEYVKTGKVKMVYRDFPLESIHPYAISSAMAAECAKDQGKYWLYHDLLFDKQNEIPTQNFIGWAEELEMNIDEFRGCFDSKKYADEIQKDLQDGLAAGVEGTPATFINGKFISGAQPYSVFKAAIEEALAGN